MVDKIHDMVLDIRSSIDNKRDRVTNLKSLLAMFTRSKKALYRRFITMGETWINHTRPQGTV